MIEELGIAGIKILLFLYRCPEGATIREIARKCKMGWDTAYGAVIKLQYFRLVEVGRAGRARLAALTDAGRWVAERLAEIDERLVEIFSYGA